MDPNGAAATRDSMTDTTPVSTDQPINDDVFEYPGSGGMSQCISGFGRNAIERIHELLREDERQSPEYENVRWHVNELVRWCRHFNGETQRLRAEVRRLAGVAEAEERDCLALIDERDGRERMLDEFVNSVGGVDVCGEHSNLNDPWRNALNHVDGMVWLINRMRDNWDSGGDDWWDSLRQMCSLIGRPVPAAPEESAKAGVTR